MRRVVRWIGASTMHAFLATLLIFAVAFSIAGYVYDRDRGHDLEGTARVARQARALSEQNRELIRREAATNRRIAQDTHDRCVERNAQAERARVALEQLAESSPEPLASVFRSFGANAMTEDCPTVDELLAR